MAGRRVMVWLEPEQIALVRAVARAAELELVLAGSPVRGQSTHVAAEFETASGDDLRAALASVDCDLAWIVSPGAFGSGPGGDDASAVLAAHSRGVKIAALEPIPGAALDIRSGGWAGGEAEVRPLNLARHCPLTRLSAPFLDAAETIEGFGSIGTLAVEALCGAGEGSLGARVYGSLELVQALMGEPETVEATYVAAGPGRAVHALPGETLRGLRGDLAATLRFADGRAASVVASDRAGCWSQACTLIGQGGRLRIAHDGFEWISPEGRRLDHSRERGRARKSQPTGAGEALTWSLSRMLDPSIPDPAPGDRVAVLAMAQAALLSCRTGQGESPATIRRVVGLG